MSASGNALASLTFAVPSRVEAVQALMRDAVTTLNAVPPAGFAPLPARNEQANAKQAATVAGVLTDPALAKGSAGVLAAAPAAASLTDTSADNLPQGSAVRIGALGRALAAALPATSPSGINTVLPLPEVDVPALDTARFASWLAHAVTQSGTSYEAHLLEWVEGKRSLNQVRAEPRAHTAAPAASPLAAAPTAAANPAPVLSMTPNAALTAAPVPNTTSLTAGADVAHATHAAESSSLPWTSAQQITAAQMRCIDSGELRFALPAWPGQGCELRLRPDHRSPAPSYGEAGAPQGDGTLVLTLPHLGRVEVRLRTGGDNVQVTLRAASADAACHFNGATAALSHGLGLAGLKLVSVVVHEPRA